MLAPADGEPPYMIDHFLDAKAPKDIKKGELITIETFYGKNWKINDN